MWNGVLCGLLAGALWGMVFIVPEILAAFSPLEMALGRYAAYGAIALGLMAPRLPSLLQRLVRSDYAALVRHALAGNIVYYMLLALGVKLAGVAPTSLIIESPIRSVKRTSPIAPVRSRNASTVRAPSSCSQSPSVGRSPCRA